MAALTDRLRAHPPLAHSDDEYYGLAWAALAWLEDSLDASMTTLETGAGASTVVFAAAGCAHTAVSPDPEEHRRIADWCRSAGVATDRLRFVAESSTDVLPREATGDPLDLALIDGAHSFPYPAVDWFYVAPRLKVGGLLVVDDAHLAPVNVLVRYLHSSPSWHRERVLGRRVVVLRKLDDAAPAVEPDWTGGSLDGRRRFDYLPPARRLAAWAIDRTVDRGPLRGLVARRLGRERR